MTRPSTWLMFICGVIVAVGVLIARAELWSGSTSSSGQPSVGLTSAQAAQREISAESIEQAFIRAAEDVGPAVVSISTEQIEQVRSYYRGHPFFGQGPFEELFRDFFGGAPPHEFQREFKRFGLGSGVIIDGRGLILTNEHVAANADKITVTLADGREFEGEIKGKDIRSDLAVVKIDAKNLPVASLGDSESIKAGQWAIALGNPFGLVGTGAQGFGAEPTMTVGVISALNRRLPIMSRSGRDYSGLIQTDAAINQGNSGGPLLNLKGEVIGINVLIVSTSGGFEGVGFAIPINKAKAILDDLIEGRKILYGWLGIQIQDITQDVAEYYGLSDRDGVLVYQVLSDSPAERAGMKDGDIVKVFQGQPISNARELVDLVGKTKVGRKVPVEILRDRKRQVLMVEVGERPGEAELAEGEATSSWRGLTVAELTQALVDQFGLSAETTGVVVTDVEPDSPAGEANVQPGDVINEINRLRIESLNDYRKAVATVKDNALVRTNRGYVVVKAGP